MNNIATKPFLQQVADNLHERFPNGFRGVTVVFPNRRARLFLNDYLYHAFGQPVWEPNYVDFSELTARPSGYFQADTIELVFYLYNALVEVYHERYKTVYNESFDEFYYFGETLLRDFDDVDQNLVDAKRLFANLTELHDLDDTFDHLDETQRDIVRHFFHNLQADGDKSELKRRFAEIWNLLFEVYTRFKATLSQLNIAYPGMMARRTVERIKEGEADRLFPDETYVFIGFNVLTKCEQEVFGALKNRALFYWDTDSYFLGDDVVQEAGRFLRNDLQSFPNALPKVESNLQALSDVTIVEAPNDTAQAAYISQWVTELKHQSFETPDSAIVLCNEKLMGITLRNIPDKVDKVNITMGYPLAQTPVCTFVQQLTDLAATYKAKDEEAMKQGLGSSDAIRLDAFLAWFDHAYTRTFFYAQDDTTDVLTRSQMRDKLVSSRRYHLSLAELEPYAQFSLLVSLLRSRDSVTFLQRLAQLMQFVARSLKHKDPLEQEAIYRVVCLVNRLSQVQSGKISLELPITLRFIHRLMSSESIPYHGEPKEGLQVMGMLETRNMDFDNVLLLSVNEGLLPKVKGTASSFVPNLLRRAYGMSHTDHQDSLYAYHFYHLLQRAKRVTMVYVNGKEGGSKVEVSRFILQLLAEHPNRAQFRRVKLSPYIDLTTVKPVAISKDSEDIKHELSQLGQEKPLSPSAINTYLDCKLQFYFSKILHLKEENELSDEVDNALLGNLFHRAMEYCYLHIGLWSKMTISVGKWPDMRSASSQPFKVEQLDINTLLQDKKRIEAFVLMAYNKECFGREPHEQQLSFSSFSGEQRIYFDLVKEYVVRQLEFDLRQAPFTIVGLEQERFCEVTLDNGFKLKIGGVIDRLQQDAEGNWQLMDYKTSSKRQKTGDLDSLFHAPKDRGYHALQTLVYCSVLKHSLKDNKPITPYLLYVNTFKDETTLNDAVVALNCPGSKTVSPEPINSYNEVAGEFEPLLKTTLEEIFDLEQPFVPDGGEKACKYCQFALMCQRAIDQSESDDE